MNFNHNFMPYFGTRKTAIWIIAALIAYLCGLWIAQLNPHPLLFSCAVALGFIAFLTVKWLTSQVKFVGALSVTGIVILFGFLGSFVEVNEWVSPVYITVRWIAPLMLLAIGIKNILSSPKITEYIMNSWGTLSKPVILFTLYAAISVLYSPAPFITAGRAFTFASITIGIATALWPTIQQRADAERLLKLIALIMACIILPGQIYLFLPESIGWHSSGRFRSTFWNPVTLSHLCALLAPLYWWIGSDRTIKNSWRIASYMMLGILVVNIYLSGSRSGAVAFLVTVLYLSWSLVQGKIRYLLTWLLTTLLIFTILIQPLSTQSYFTRGATLANLYELTSGRYNRWEIALNVWSDASIVGTGFGTFGQQTYSSLEGQTSSIQSRTAGLRYSNLYFEILASGGLVGILILGYLLFCCLSMFRKALRQENEPRPLMFHISYAIFMSGLILNLSETWLISAGSPFAMYWWLVLFLTSRVIDLGKRKDLKYEKL